MARPMDRCASPISNSAPKRVTGEYFGFLADFSRGNDLPSNIHILETKTQRVLGIERFDKPLVRLETISDSLMSACW
jgi:5-methylthioadenosine/S-adenosylhomocysteine deaminase